MKTIESTEEIKPIIEETPVASGTTKAKNKTIVSETVGIGQGVKKDSTKKTTSTTTITHNAPDQERIDSIKNTKLKNKK